MSASGLYRLFWRRSICMFAPQRGGGGTAGSKRPIAAVAGLISSRLRLSPMSSATDCVMISVRLDMIVVKETPSLTSHCFYIWPQLTQRSGRVEAAGRGSGLKRGQGVDGNSGTAAQRQLKVFEYSQLVVPTTAPTTIPSPTRLHLCITDLLSSNAERVYRLTRLTGGAVCRAVIGRNQLSILKCKFEATLKTIEILSLIID